MAAFSLFEVKKMKTMELLNLDCTKEENAEIIQKALKRIKPFSKCEGDVELEKLEKFIQKISVKYHIMIQWITPTFTNKIESMYFGMKTYGENLETGDICLKLSLKFDGENAIKNNDFDLGKTSFKKYIEAFVGQENIDYSDINKEIIDKLKNGDKEVEINNTLDGLKEEIIATKECIIYKLSTKKYKFADAEKSMK